MKRIFDLKNLTAFLALFFIVGALPSLAQTRRPVLKHRTIARKKVVRPIHTEPLYSIAAGTSIRARMNGTLSSRTARIGNTFTATVTEPVYSDNGVVVVPIGSTVIGRVDSVVPAAKGGRPGQIGVSFTRVRLPNGRSHAINGSLTDLVGSNTRSDNESTATGKKMNNRKLIFIGGGTAGGAILGGAIGGGKGAAIGALLGAGGGFLGERYTKGKEAEVQSGTEFGVYVNQAFSLPKFAETTPVNP
jgi:hypothetical protein